MRWMRVIYINSGWRQKGRFQNTCRKRKKYGSFELTDFYLIIFIMVRHLKIMTLIIFNSQIMMFFCYTIDCRVCIFNPTFR